MIFSEQWLQEWVNPQMDTEELMAQLTMAGLEVDGISGVANDFSGVVVGEIIALESHPDADKLNVCRVSTGVEDFQVVCGAPNVRVGLKAPFATLGAELFSAQETKPFRIKKAKLRGIESHGMLCSSAELGISDDADGLLELPEDSPIGSDLREYLQLDDSSIELDLTPNRGDCLGMIGLAREVGVIARENVKYPEITPVATTISDAFPIIINAPRECPRYLGRVIRDINPDAITPNWMSEKLRRCGLRAIDPVVDVTNYVLIELGHPMHAFDLAKLNDHIDVRLAQEGEKLTLLDGKEVDIDASTLVIADKEKVLAMAGIMGGLDSSVTKETKDVFLECAFFAPLAIAGKARSYGMHTDASHRYERGVDHQLQQRAMERATQLLLDIVGGEAGPVTEAIGELPAQAEVSLRMGSMAGLLGIDIATDEVIDILERLGFEILTQTPEAVTVKVPSFRFDISIEADLIEEIARIYGYNRLPKTSGLNRQSLSTKPEREADINRYRSQLVGLGYQEIITYSFIAPDLSKLLFPDIEPIQLQNPISQDMSVMRSSLLPGLLTTLKHNENRQQDRTRLFESGLVFRALDDQPKMLGGLISGALYPKNWNNNNKIVDFYDVKGDVESLLQISRSRTPIEFEKSQHSALHSGQCAALVQAGTEIGHIGALHPAVARSLGISSSVYLFEVDLQALQQGDIPRSQALSVFPEVSRDLAIVIDRKIEAAQILETVRGQAGEHLTDLRIFDVYQGDAVAESQKSVALGLTWQHPSRTLSEEDINDIISNCVKALEDKFNANLRN